MSGQLAMMDLGGLPPSLKLVGNGSTTVTDFGSTREKTITIAANQLKSDSNGGYAVDIDTNNVDLLYAVVKYPVTETIHDLIDFSSGTSGKNGGAIVYSGTGSASNGLYVCSSGSGSLTTSLGGDIELTIAPSLGSTSSTFKFTKGPDTTSKTISGSQTLKISASDMVKSGSYFSVSFSMTNIALLKARLTNVQEKITYPTALTTSRVVDFSQNVSQRPAYNSKLVTFGVNASGKMTGVGQSYDADLGYWVTSDVGSPAGTSSNNNFYNSGLVGDFFCLMQDVGSGAPLVHWADAEHTTGGTANALYLPGMARTFLASDLCLQQSDGRSTSFELYNLATGGRCKMIYGGFSLPLNAVLFNGAQKEILNKYTWQQKDTTSVTDPNIACANVTKDACKKLKADYGSNIRIYVVKYRKQANYKHKISGTTVNHDYAYLNECAGPGNSASSTSAPYMQEADDEAGLKTALQTIAADIKTFAGRSEAKNTTATP
jgi:hypothetical protein